jgi:methyl coenzyme M reductase subunit C
MSKANKNKINIMHMPNKDKHIIKISKLILHATNIIQ